MYIYRLKSIVFVIDKNLIKKKLFCFRKKKIKNPKT